MTDKTRLLRWVLVCSDRGKGVCIENMEAFLDMSEGDKHMQLHPI